MDREYWQQVEKIIDVALTLDEPEQNTYVEETCVGQEKLLKEVKQILQSIKASDDHQFLEMEDDGGRLFMNEFRQEFDKTEQQFLLGKEIGPWRITERIGSGGMGTVFKAERVDGAFHQTVAVKLIRFGAGSKEHLNRFKLEREILARLNHPNIAGIYDGGVTEEGLPYLVMQYVDGKPIDEWCDQNRCSIEERIKLFQEVCRAVEYAHNNLIVHRDLKPQNIYVTEEGDVKILDFGIAKLLDISRYEESRPQTRTGQWLGTPHYMAPEQIQGDPVTIASDIYSLGVLLHQMLCGTFPFDFSGKKIFETEQMIVTQDPVSPSRSVSSENLDIAHNRQFQNIGHLKKYLSGDLDAIVLQTLKKAPEERYGSTGRLLEDLHRYESGLPVSARPDSTWYRAKKFVRRQALPVSIAAAALILVTTGLSIAWFNNQARLAEAERSQSLSQFMLRMFDSVTPTERQGEEFTITQLLNSGIDRAQVELGSQPELLHRVLFKIVGTHLTLGNREHASEIADLIDTNLAALPADNLANLEALSLRGDLQRAAEDWTEALRIYERVLTEMDAHPDADREHLMSARVDMARTLLDLHRPDEAEPHVQEALEIAGQSPSLDPRDALAALSNIHFQRGEMEQVMDVISRILDHAENWDSGRNTISLAGHHYDGSTALVRLGRFDEALIHIESALNIIEQLEGVNSPLYARYLVQKAIIFEALDRYPEALPASARAIEILRASRPDSEDLRTALGVHAGELMNLGRQREAISSQEELLALFERIGQPDDWGAVVTRMMLAIAQLADRDINGSLATTRQAQASLARSPLPPDAQQRFNMKLRLAAQEVMCLTLLGDFESALASAGLAQKELNEARDDDVLQVQGRYVLSLWEGVALEQLGNKNEAGERFAEAERLGSLIPETLVDHERNYAQRYRKTGNPFSPNTGDTEIVQSENN